MEIRLLGSLVERKIGYGIVQPGQSIDGGVPVIKVNNLITGLTSVKDLDTTSTETAAKYSRTKLKGGELIVSVVGTIGKTAIVPAAFAGCNLVRATALIDIPEQWLSYWVKYYIDSPAGQAYIDQNLNTTVQPTLNIKSLVEMPIPFFDETLMKRAVAFLKTIDDKIATNNRINDNLQQQAMALYASMFLDNPALKTTAGTLKDIADITMGQSPSGSSYNEDGNGEVFYQGRAEFGYRFPTRRLYTTEPKRMAEAGDVLLSVRAPVGDLNVAYERCCIGRGLGAIHGRNGYQSFVLYTMFALRPQLDVYNGEGTVFGSLHRNALNDMPIDIPSEDAISAFEAVVRPMDNMIRSNYEENCRLQELRASLLPRLMSGEVEVSDIDI